MKTYTTVTKLIHEKAEAGRIALRNLRKDAREEIERQEKSGALTEEVYRGKE